MIKLGSCLTCMIFWSYDSLIFCRVTNFSEALGSVPAWITLCAKSSTDPAVYRSIHTAITGVVTSAKGRNFRALGRNKSSSTTVLTSIHPRKVHQRRKQRSRGAVSILTILVRCKVVALPVLQETHVLIQAYCAEALESWDKMAHSTPKFVGKNSILELADHMPICQRPIPPRPQKAASILVSRDNDVQKEPSSIPQDFSAWTSSLERTSGITAHTKGAKTRAQGTDTLALWFHVGFAWQFVILHKQELLS